MHCEGKLKLKSHNTSYCLIEVVTKAGLTVSPFVHYITQQVLTVHSFYQPMKCNNSEVPFHYGKTFDTPLVIGQFKFAMTTS
jgi:hypothetical protein